MRRLREFRPTRRPVVGALAALLLAAFVGGGLAQARIETGVSSFLPSADPAMERYEELSRSFGGDAIVVLIESDKPRDLLGSKRLPEVLALEGQLSRVPDVARVFGPATTLNQIAGQAQILLAELTGRRDGLRASAERAARQRGASDAEVRSAGEAAVAGFDRRYGPMIVEGLPVGLPTLRNSKFVNNVLYNAAGEPRPQWRYVVPGERSVAVLLRPEENLDQARTAALMDAITKTAAGTDLGGAEVTVAGAPSIVVALGEQATKEIPLLGAAAITVIGLCLFLVPWTPRRARRLLPLAVTVVAVGLTVATLGWLGLPISLGVVAFLPVLAGLGAYYSTYFVRRARTRVVLVIAAATAASFASLALSPLPFVRDLGITFALGIVSSVAVGWVAARRLFPAAQAEARSDAPVRAAVPPPAPRTKRLFAGGVAAVLAVLGWVALPSIGLQTNFAELTEGLAATEEAEAVEAAIGSSGELAVLLSGKNVLSPEAWRWMRAVQQKIVTEHGDEVRPVVSPPGLFAFLGDKPTEGQIRAAYRLLPSYLSRAVVREDARFALMSYGVRLSDLAHLRELTGEMLRELPPPPEGYRAELSGLPMVAVRGYELVSADRYLAGLAGVVVAGAVLLVGLRRRVDAVRAVVAAVLATGIELSLIWLGNIPLNPVTVALGSLTAAVACEFTVITAEAARRGDPGLRRVVLLATLTSAAGYAVLSMSELAVMRQFGLLLTLSVGLSYLAARFVVWAWPVGGREADSAAKSTSGRAPVLVGGS